MKVLMISFSVNGAMGDNFKMIARNLSKLCEVSVLTNKSVKPEDVGTDRICNVRFDRKMMVDFINPVSYCKIYRYIKETVFDVCFIYSPHPVNLFIYRIVSGKRIIIFIHDHVFHSGVGYFDACFLKPQYRDYYNRSAKIIVSCNFVKREILKLGLMKDEKKIAVNYLGLLDNLVCAKRKATLDIDVLFFGRIEYYKGLDILVEAGKQMKNVKFVIAGKGNMTQIFGMDCLPSNFEHLNRYIPDEELAGLIRHSKIIVLPYRDATGTQVIQSVFFYEKPVIVTNVGCFPEYVEDGVDGIVVPALDVVALQQALEKLLENTELRKTMGRNGFKKLSVKFSNDRITKEYISIFKSIFNG